MERDHFTNTKFDYWIPLLIYVVAFIILCPGLFSFITSSEVFFLNYFEYMLIYYDSALLIWLSSSFLAIVATILVLLKKKQLRQARRRKNSRSRTGQDYSQADEIIKLKKLLDDGVISLEEFETMKEKYINS